MKVLWVESQELILFQPNWCLPFTFPGACHLSNGGVIVDIGVPGEDGPFRGDPGKRGGLVFMSLAALCLIFVFSMTVGDAKRQRDPLSSLASQADLNSWTGHQ